MGVEVSDIAAWGYGVAAGAYALFGLYLFMAWRGGTAGAALLGAVSSSALWAAAGVVQARFPGDATQLASGILDVVRWACWLGFLVVLLRPLGGPRLRWHGSAAIAVVVASLLSVLFGQVPVGEPTPTSLLALAAPLCVPVLGLVLVEQLYRNLPQQSRWGLKPLCLGLAAGFIFELYLFADAFLFGRLDADVVAVRGIPHAMVIPLIALSAARTPSWTVRIAMSREMVFHSTALAVTGAYLLVIAAAGYYVRYFGGTWGRALQMTLLFAGLLLLGVFVFSGSQRARLRVLISKHLFPYRYDYRNEWLRFTQALSQAGGTMDLGQSVIKALADLVESPGGTLWLRDPAGRYVMSARLNHPASDAVEPGEGPFCRFLDEREWIIDLAELRAHPAKYDDLMLPIWLSTMEDAWLVVPLKSPEALVGFVVLGLPRAPFEINWEVLDLLKTAERQAASYLARMQAAEALLESRKFDSFNRMSAFVVHDLKNLVAQLALMLKNAERHRHNPEFQDDMIETVAHVEARMRALMTQLQDKKSVDPRRTVDVRLLVENVRMAKRHQLPSVSVVAPEAALEVSAHPERLERVIGHLVQNALDATPEGGIVSVRMDRPDSSKVRVVIADNGCGMSASFIRDQLFRPFQTSKASGMGIGVYEVRQYVTELGGTVRYESEEGRGTSVTLTLPSAARLAESKMPEVEQPLS